MSFDRFKWKKGSLAGLLSLLVILSLPGLATAQNPKSAGYTAVEFPFWIEVSWERFQNELQTGGEAAASQVIREARKTGTAQGITRFDLFSSLLIQKGMKALDDKQNDRALMFGRLAREWSPGFPNASFFLARALMKDSPFNIFRSAFVWSQGVFQGLGDFWSTYYTLGHGLLVFSAGVFGAFILVSLYIFFRSLPLITHSLYEWGLLGKRAKWGIGILILILPAITGWGLGIGILILLAFSWQFSSRAEHILQAGFVLMMGSAFLWLPFAFSIFIAGLSVDIRLMAHSIQGQAGSPAFSRKEKTGESSKKDFDFLVSKALIDQRQENHAPALASYLSAQKIRPGQSLVDINKGNIYFATQRHDQAIASYKEAMKKNAGSLLPHYNLNIIYTDLFQFDEAKLALEAAQRIDLSATQHLTSRTRGVVSELPGQQALWKKVFAPWDYKTAQAEQLFGMLFTPLELARSPVIFVVFLAALGVFRVFFGPRYLSQPCHLCSRPICFQCQRRLFDLKVCKICWTTSRNIKRKGDLRQLKIQRKFLRRQSIISTLILPGSGHIVNGSTIRGMVFLSMVLGLIFLFFFQGWLLQPAASPGGILGLWATPFLVLGLVVLYFLAWLDLKKAQVDIRN